MTRTRSALAITMAGALALAACGSDSKSSSTTAAPTTAAATATTAAATATTAAATATTAAATGSTTAIPADFSFVLVTPGAVGDGGYTDSAVAGAKKAETEFGVKSQVIEALTTAEQETSLRSAVEAKPSIVLALSMEADTLLAVAKEFPDQKFGVPSELFADTLPDNIEGFSINVHEGSFLAGVVAGSMTKTKTLGAVIGGDSPALNQFYDAYKQGILEVCKDCKVIPSYLNFEFGDPNLGKEAASAVYDQGADIVFAIAGLSGQGVFTAAKEKGAFAIGVDSDQDADAPGTVIVSMMKRTDQTTYLLVKDAAQGNFKPGFNQLSMKDGVVDLSWTGDNSTVFEKNGPADMVAKLPAVKQLVEDYRAKILAGSFEVCDVLNKPDSAACKAVTG